MQILNELMPFIKGAIAVYATYFIIVMIMALAVLITVLRSFKRRRR